jgi:hypothetical protein
MRVHAEKQRAIDLLLFSVQANGLTDGKDVPFIKRLLEGRTAMSGGAERNPLPRDLLSQPSRPFMTLSSNAVMTFAPGSPSARRTASG